MTSPALACGRLRSPVAACSRLWSPAVADGQISLTCYLIYLFLRPLLLFIMSPLINYFRYLRISTYTSALVVILILSSSDPC